MQSQGYSYSSQFKILQKEQFLQFKKEHQQENDDLSSRNHRLHIETNRRRRALAQKKKTQAEKEERRCQMILAKRRQIIHEATEKFQRMHKTIQNNSSRDGRSRTDYTLDEALRVIRGQGRSATASPQSFRAQTAAGGRRLGSVPANLNDDDRHGLSNSRSLFEQQLNRHQHLLATQQQMALRDFAEAVIGDGMSKNAITVPVDGRMTQNGGAKVSATAQMNGFAVVPRQTNALPKHEQQRTSASPVVALPETVATTIGMPRNAERILDGQNDGLKADNGLERDSLSLCDSLDVAETKQNGLVEAREPAGLGNMENSNPSEWHLHSKSPSDNKPNGMTVQQIASDAVSATAGNTLSAKIDLVPNKDVNDAKERCLNSPNPAPADRGLQTPANVTVRNILPNKPFMFGVNGPPVFGLGAGGDNAATVGFLLHRSGNTLSPNIAVVQPNCRTNILNLESDPKTEVVKAALGVTTQQFTTDPLKTDVKNADECNDENDQNDTASSKVVDFAPGQTAPDPGTFFFSSGLPMGAKPQIDAPKRQITSLFVAGEIPVNISETKITEVTITNEKLATVDSDRSLNAVKVRDVSVENKPPTGRFKVDEASRQNTRPPDNVGQWHPKVGEKQWDIKQPNNFETRSQKTELTSEDAARKMSKPPNNDPRGILSQAAFLDEIYSDEGSSDSSTSYVRPASRIPVPTSGARVPKGILKKRLSSGPVSDNCGLLIGAVRFGVEANTSSTSLRDSLEVMKLHRKDELSAQVGGKNQKPSKKSVRFAEILCEEEPGQKDSAVGRQEEQLFFVPRPPLQEKGHAEHSSLSRPTRPISAKVMSVTSPVDPDVKVPRVASAGVMRRGPFHNPTIPSNSTPIQGSSNATPTAVSPGNAPASVTNFPPTFTVSGGKQNSDAAAEKPVRDINTISLDKTPTEEEINWLWQKVRSCLNREPSSSSMSTPTTNSNGISGNGNTTAGLPNSSGAPARQTVQVSCTNFDGSTLATRSGSGKVNTTYVNNFMGSQYPTRRRITMDTLNGYAKKTNNNLLQQRRITQPNATPTSGYPELPAGEAVYSNVNGKANITLSSRFTSVASRNPVSESMAAFLAGEDLSRHANVDDSIIVNVMDAAERRARSLANGNLTHNKIPSALSLEEERLMKSIDRLNERIGGQNVHQQSANQSVIRPFVPRPPSYAPAKARQQTPNSGRIVTYTGAVPRHYFQMGDRPVSVGNGEVKQLY